MKRVIRKIQKDEISQLYPFIHKIFTDMELPVLEEMSQDLLKEILIEAMHSPYYRYGSKHTWICEREGKIAGAFFGYPGVQEPLIDGPLQAAMLAHGFPIDMIAQENECLPNEWYLDTLVTAPDFRRQGIGQEMIQGAIDIAKKAEYSTISLNCDIKNTAAYSLYVKMGFVEKTKIVLSGHVYWHMVKEIK